jgi:hypothetical protein
VERVRKYDVLPKYKPEGNWKMGSKHEILGQNANWRWKYHLTIAFRTPVA